MPNESGPQKINTTGELRTFLADLLVNVANGSADLDAARAMVKVAAQINESFYSEIKAAQVQMETFGEASHLLGNLPIGASGEKA
jgi:hypothetical protein